MKKANGLLKLNIEGLENNKKIYRTEIVLQKWPYKSI